MKITENGKNTLINELKDFDLEQTLECGQCFRFYKLDKEEYVIVAKNKMKINLYFIILQRKM